MAGARPAMTRERARQARQQVHPRLEPRRARRRRGDRGRQRARRARAPRRRAPLLADRPRASARRQGQEREAARPAPGANSTGSSFTRSSARRASASRASRRWRASLRPRSAPTPSLRRARRNSPRPISRPRWSASSPSLQGLMGRYYASAQGEDAERRRRDRRALQAARAERPHPDCAGLDRGRARRQARHARRLLGDRRKADRQQGPLRAAARGARRDPHCAGERAATASDPASLASSD